MKLTKELKDRIKNYFDKVDPEELIDDLINNFGAKEVKKFGSRKKIS